MRYRLIGMLFLGHLFTDINQGALPAMLPFLIPAHNLSYAAAATIVFAANIASTVVQPLFGHFADQVSKPFLMPVGLLLAGIGLALVGISPDYRLIILVAVTSVVIQKCLSLICHSGLDPESSDFHLDFRFRGNDGFGISVKKC
jgi:FSR family fosmidomycin resistance protein-like MFS transporter